VCGYGYAKFSNVKDEKSTVWYWQCVEKYGKSTETIGGAVAKAR